MRRAWLVGLIALAGCGGPKPKEAIKEGKEKVREAQREVDKALRDLDKTDIPEDLKKELREAKELLDDAKD